MARFVVKGVLKLGGEERPFSREFDAPGEQRARERAYSYFGSKHGLRRSDVEIRSVEEARRHE